MGRVGIVCYEVDKKERLKAVVNVVFSSYVNAGAGLTEHTMYLADQVAKS